MVALEEVTDEGLVRYSGLESVEVTIEVNEKVRLVDAKPEPVIEKALAAGPEPETEPEPEYKPQKSAASTTTACGRGGAIPSRRATRRRGGDHPRR